VSEEDDDNETLNKKLDRVEEDFQYGDYTDD
jgi:hypothetical protein